ncbi:uncharacterized protein LOC120325917 [Styela clava]
MNENQNNAISECESSETRLVNNNPQIKKKGMNLLKKSKHDLLRLLSILEGELEARDIFISALQAQLTNQRNARQQYFVHRLTDPFLSLHRDDYVAGNSTNDDENRYYNEQAFIEPLPLLEKVVYQFKSQQQKMHQQMSLASKIHRKMAHELAEEKRKHAADTKTGDDVTMALEKERERLNASVLCEKERTKRIEGEYRKLLGLCKEENTKHKMIVVSLLAEQERLRQQLTESKELQIDIDSTETELQARLHQALKEKQDLAIKLKEEQNRCSSLKLQMRILQEKSTQRNLNQTTNSAKTALEHATELYSCGDSEESMTPELPIKMCKAQSFTSSLDSNTERDMDTVAHFFAKHHPMSVAQNTQDVTLIPTSSHPPILLADGVEGVTTSGYYSVKPGSTIAGLEAMRSTAQSKEILKMEYCNNNNDTSDKSKEIKQNIVYTDMLSDKTAESLSLNLKPQPPSVTVPPKPNRFVPGSPHYSPFRSPQTLFNEKTHSPMTSSPTSGAANFAMNSPNAPTPPHGSPFSITRTPSVKGPQKFTPSKLDTPVKLSDWALKNSSPGRTPIKSSPNPKFQATRLKFQQNNGIALKSTDSELIKPMKESLVTEKKIQTKKFSPVNYKSHLSQKVSPSSTVTSLSTTLPNVPTISSKQESMNENEKVKPLPPKTRTSSAPPSINTVTSDQARPPPLPPKKPNLNSEKPTKRSTSLTSEVRNSAESSSFQRKVTGSVIKRNTSSQKTNSTNSENCNNNSIGNGKRVKAPVPPSLPAKLSSQQPQLPTPPAGPRQPLSTQQRVYQSSNADSNPMISPAPNSATSKTQNTFFGT